MLRRGIVVATHPEDHSVDLVMSDNGARLTGVQVSTPSGSTRTGNVDLPHVPQRSNKWDVTEETDQELIALVAPTNGGPVVIGFIYPQVNQVLFNDPQLKYGRHQSDVSWLIDGDGNIQLQHPSGAFIKIGENPELIDLAGKNADGNAKLDRNTGRKVYIRAGLAGNAAVVTLTPEGDMQVKLERNMEVDAEGSIRMATKQTFDLIADGDVTLRTKASATVSAAGDVSISAGGRATITAPAGANITAGNSSVSLASSGRATINAPSGAVINAPTLRVNGDVSAKDFHKG